MPIISYEDYKIKKADLLNTLHSAAEVIDKLSEIGLSFDAQVLLDLFNKLKEDNFKVLVIGEFKNGKSTFINALMGEKVLPAYSTPCTAVINEVVYGEEKQATLFFKNPLPQEISPDISVKAKQHMRKYNGAESIPPYEILDISELEDYVSIPDPTKDQSESIQELPYSRVILRYPVALCRDGIEIIDSPGLNENETRTRVTADYLNKADAILFVFRCPKIAGINEMSYINDHIRVQGHEDIFFICNCINLVPEDERARLIKFGNQKLAPLTGLGESGVFYVDALGALNARTKHNTDQLSETGIPQFEAALSEYLRNNRGKAKLLSILTPFIRFLDITCMTQAESYAQSLKQGVKAFEQRITDAMPSLELAKCKETLIAGKIDSAMDKLHNEAKEKVSAQYDRIIKGIPEYVKTLDLDNRLTLNIFKHKDQQNALIREIYEKLENHVSGEMSRWINEDLKPYLERTIEGIERDIGQDIDEFYDGLDTFRYNVSNVAKPKSISGFERVGAAIVGTMAGGLLNGAMGLTLGFGEALKRGVLTYGASIVGVVLLSITPLSVATVCNIALAAYATSLGAQSLSSGKILTENLKKELAKSFAAEMKRNKEASCESYADELKKTTYERFSMVTQALRREVEIEERKIESLRDDFRRNEKECQDKIVALGHIKAELNMLKAKTVEMKASVE